MRLVKIEAGLPERIQKPQRSKAPKSWLEPKVVQVKLSIKEDKKVRRILDRREANAQKLEGRVRPIKRKQ